MEKPVRSLLDAPTTSISRFCARWVVSDCVGPPTLQPSDTNEREREREREREKEVGPHTHTRTPPTGTRTLLDVFSKGSRGDILEGVGQECWFLQCAW